MASITVLKENVPHGPFTREQVAEQLARGEITPDSLAFIEGLTQWTPLRDVLAKVDGAAAPPPVPPRPVAAMPIGTGYALAGPVAPVGAMPIGTGYSFAATMQPPTHLLYAGFWRRFVALFIDGLITIPFSIPYYICNWGFGATQEQDSSLRIAWLLGMIVSWIFLVVGRWLYFSLQESSSVQATVGKRLLDIYVTDRQGARIGFGRATGRYFGKIVSGIIFCIGFMMAGWTERKQALHDMMADTLVVRKPGA